MMFVGVEVVAMQKSSSSSSEEGCVELGLEAWRKPGYKNKKLA